MSVWQRLANGVCAAHAFVSKKSGSSGQRSRDAQRRNKGEPSAGITDTGPVPAAPKGNYRQILPYCDKKAKIGKQGHAEAGIDTKPFSQADGLIPARQAQTCRSGIVQVQTVMLSPRHVVERSWFLSCRHGRGSGSETGMCRLVLEPGSRPIVPDLCSRFRCCVYTSALANNELVNSWRSRPSFTMSRRTGRSASTRMSVGIKR